MACLMHCEAADVHREERVVRIARDLQGTDESSCSRAKWCA
jgi:hypothetical protein